MSTRESAETMESIMNPATPTMKHETLRTDTARATRHERRTVADEEMESYVAILADAFASSSRRGATFTDGAFSPWG
jgi:hypothetical protein